MRARSVSGEAGIPQDAQWRHSAVIPCGELGGLSSGGLLGQIAFVLRGRCPAGHSHVARRALAGATDPPTDVEPAAVTTS